MSYIRNNIISTIIWFVIQVVYTYIDFSWFCTMCSSYN